MRFSWKFARFDTPYSSNGPWRADPYSVMLDILAYRKQWGASDWPAQIIAETGEIVDEIGWAQTAPNYDLARWESDRNTPHPVD